MSGLAACSAITPTAPMPVTLSIIGPPASLTIAAAATATSLGDVLLNLSVLDATNRGVPGETIFLTTTTGTLNHASVVTGPTGTAQAIVTITRSALITAQARTFTATTKAIAYSLPLSVSAGANPSNPFKGDDVTFTASVSGGVAPFTYAWTFGDGGSGTGDSPTHRYSSDGSKNIRLTVTDADDRTGATSTSVTVQSDPVIVSPTPAPAPTLTATLTCTEGDDTAAPSTCNVTVSYGGSPLASLSIAEVRWDWGDGTPLATTTVPVATHQYGNVGTFTALATVTATTSDGAKTATTSKALVIS